jgi:hypothetical protein
MWKMPGQLCSRLLTLDNLQRILYTASASSFWMDRSLLKTQSYQRRGGLSPFPGLLERISPTPGVVFLLTSSPFSRTFYPVRIVVYFREPELSS